MKAGKITPFKRKFEGAFLYEIKDEIWGSVPITDIEHKIINHRDFNRLIEINQMGVAHVEFPGARHCRYHHSIGVLYVADFLLRNIIYLGPDESGKGKSHIPLITHDEIDEDVWKAFRIAALCHDIGHPPLSHVIEEGLRKNPEMIPSSKELKDNSFLNSIQEKYSHEEATRYKLQEGDIYDIIRQKIGDISKEQLVDLSIGKAKDFPYTLLNPIINSDLDADKLDYLKRDGFHCGFFTTYELSDFEDAIYMTIEKEEPGYQPILLINKEKIGAVNAFLYSRYREIAEFHYAPNVRKATQMAIEILIKRINSLDTILLKKRFILDLHLKYRDGDFWECFRDTNTDLLSSADKLRRSDASEYSEILPTYKNDIKDTIDFEDLSPIDRIRTHTILSFPPSISHLQEIIRYQCDDQSLLVDVRTAKPPQFSLYVKLRDIPLPIFHVSETAKGILRDSISFLNIFFYSKKNPKPKIDAIRVINNLKRVADRNTNIYYKKYGKVFGHLVIMIVLGSLLNLASDEFDFKDPWLDGQIDLQKMIQEICKGKENPYENENTNKAHPKFVRDIETLVTMGLLTEKKIIVNFPTKNGSNEKQKLNLEKVNYINIPRIQYQLNNYGKKYYKDLLNFNKNMSVSKKMMEIKERTIEIQKVCKDDIVIFNQLSKKIHLMRTKINREFVEIQNLRHERRKSVRRNYGCLVIDNDADTKNGETEELLYP